MDREELRTRVLRRWEELKTEHPEIATTEYDESARILVRQGTPFEQKLAFLVLSGEVREVLRVEYEGFTIEREFRTVLPGELAFMQALIPEQRDEPAYASAIVPEGEKTRIVPVTRDIVVRKLIPILALVEEYKLQCRSMEILRSTLLNELRHSEITRLRILLEVQRGELKRLKETTTRNEEEIERLRRDLAEVTVHVTELEGWFEEKPAELTAPHEEIARLRAKHDELFRDNKRLALEVVRLRGQKSEPAPRDQSDDRPEPSKESGEQRRDAVSFGSGAPPPQENGDVDPLPVGTPGLRHAQTMTGLRVVRQNTLIGIPLPSAGSAPAPSKTGS